MPKSNTELRQLLANLDGRSYPAYKDIRGSYAFDDFTLFIDHVQGDPFAAPSRVRVRVPMSVAQFPAQTHANHSRLVALRDFLV
ncbi:MAG: ABC-ATPase domain-containing protein, partial [Anaerolineae bacterium]|nr:ABC-ATPase domain-containing protein [Anaerolineae bacterium]